MASDETTPLRLSEPDRSYVYMSARNRAYRSKVRQFQCCICAGLLGTFVVAAIVTVSYMMNHDPEDNPDNSTVIPPVQQPELQQLLTASWPRPDSHDLPTPPSYDSMEIDAALAAGRASLKARDQMEKDFPPVVLAPSHPSFLHHKAMYSSPTANKAARIGTILVAATKKLHTDKPGKWDGRGPRLPPSDWMSPQWCPAKDYSPRCRPSPFRSADGTCNNLKNPDYGVIMRPFRRALPPTYGDGVSSPRRATDGSELPSAREVSLTVHRPMYRNDPHFTVVLAVWGQFVDHDFTATALSQRSDGSAITCCNNGWQHPECFPVPLKPADPFYAQYNITCIDFVRSAPAPTCSLGPREQFNQVTPYIDGSVVYGGNAEQMSDLRTFSGGLLASSRSADGRELLPTDTKPQDGCNQEQESSRGRYCFKSGDARANENLHLTTMHLILARQHNRLAKQLQELNPKWNDERLFQESRRIVAAQMQHVTFNEFLPIVIGQDLSDHLELTPKKKGYYHGYDSSINIQIANEFASCAFRFGHTLLQGLLKMIAHDTVSEEYVQLHKMLFNPFGLYDPGYMDKAVRGALHTDIQRADPYFSTEVSQKLFKPKSGPCGLDLVSLNVQRGRDHGLQAYPAWREHCGLSRPKSFADLESIMDNDTVARLTAMYRTVDDIDMYTGLVSETPLSATGILGPTATCIITDQFVRFKKGDRYWYETPEAPQAFTPVQLDEIRKTTLSSLLCDNSDNLDKVQPRSMQAITPENPMTNCADLPRPDFTAWSENPRVHISGHHRRGRRPRKNGNKRPVPTAEEHYRDVTYDPTLHYFRSSSQPQLVVGATVTTGTITGSYSAGPLLTLWDGNFPAAIPSPFLDYPLPAGETPPSLPAPGTVEQRGGALWGGSIQMLSGDTLKLSANYHLPIFAHGAGSFEQKWWCGEADLEMRVNWNSTELHGITENNLFSPIGFKKSKTLSMSKNTFMTLFEEESAIGKLQASVDRAPLDPNSVPRFPIMLLGQYNEDNTVFWWNGNITLVFPTVVSSKPILAAPKSTKSFTTVVFGGTVVDGEVSTDDGQIWWDGTLPLDISVPQAAKSAVKDLFHGGSAMITGSFDMSTPGLINFTADFSAPFSNETDAASILWIAGAVDASIQVAWNSSTINTLTTEPENMFCMVILKNKTKMLSSSQNDVISTEELLALTPGAPTIVPQLLLILEGQYSETASFSWSGKITVIIAPSKPKEPKLSLSFTKKSEKPKYHISPGDSVSVPWKSASQNLVVGATVTTGVITGSYSAGPLLTLWDGTFPAAIPSPFLDYPMPAGMIPPPAPAPGTVEQRGGALWGGTIEVLSGSTLKLSANYHLPIFVHGAGSFDQKWWCGEADLQMTVNWNSTTLHGQSEGNFFSPIGFKKVYQSSSSAEYAFMNLFANEAGVGLLQESVDRAPLDPASVPRFPLILQGQYNADNTVFWWNGNVTLVFPKPMPEPQQLQTAPKQKSFRRVAFGGSVVSGTVSLDTGAKFWDGTLPFNINLQKPITARDLLHGGNAMVTGYFDVTMPGAVNFYANFSAPFNDASTPGLITWLPGAISANIQVSWNASNIATLPATATNMYCMVFLRETSNLLISSTDQNDELDPDAILALSPGAPTMFPQIILILQGQFSEDTTFTWNGKITATVQPPKPRNLLTHPFNVVAPHARRLVLGGSVVSGKITAYSGGMPKKIWFDGSLPVAIPMPAFDRYLPPGQAAPGPETTGPIFHGHGILWSGSVEPRSGSRQIEVYGEFRLPIYEHGETFSQEWWQGHVELVVDVAWNSTWLNSAKVASIPESDFFSPIRFRPDEPPTSMADEYARLQSSDPDMMQASPVLSNTDSPFYPKGPMPRFPIILHGFMNKDRSAFMWSGNLTMVFPYPY